jgi:hypothetical protein
VAKVRYLPWGETWEAMTDTMPITQTNFHFTGQREEADIGLYDYKARWLALALPMLSDSFGIANDAQLGRFVQPDPIVPDPGDPQSLNRYSYAKNNPVRFTDPSGHYYYDPSLDALVHNDVPTLEHPEYLERKTAYEMTNPLGATIVQGMLIQERYETAIGVRLEMSGRVPPGFGLDIDADLLYKDDEGFRIFFTPSGGFMPSSLPIPIQGDITGGLLLVTNLPTLDDYSGLTVTVGGTAALGYGLEADVSTSVPLDLEEPFAWYLGLGGGLQGSGYVMLGDAQDWPTWRQRGQRVVQLLGLERSRRKRGPSGTGAR